MKLVTFQTIEAVNDLFKKGYLECNKNKINLEKTGPTYKWILNRMNERIPNPNNVDYPLWCWVKCYNGICPPKKKGKRVEGFDVKITFNKKEKEEFEKLLQKYNITKEELKAYVRLDKYKSHRTDKEYIDVCNKIRKNFDRCITKNSNVLQGCVWRINLDEVEKIEILKDDGYVYGSLNYIRSNGKRIDWQKDYYKLLK